MQHEQKNIGTRNKVRLNKTEVKKAAVRCAGARFHGGVTAESPTRVFSLYLHQDQRASKTERRVTVSRGELVDQVIALVREEFPDLDPGPGVSVTVGIGEDGGVSGAKVVWYEGGEGEED